MSLPGRLREQIMLALLDAFDYGELQILVSTHLETDLAHITPVQGTLQEIVFALTAWSEAQGKTRLLLLAAAETRPERTIFPYLVAQLDEVAAAAGDGTRDPKFIIPFPPNLEFFGRAEELARLHAVLQEQAEQVVGIRPIAGLTGMGGIGKTQLAVMYSYQHRADYPGGIFWLNAAEGLPEAFAKLGRQLNPALVGGAREPQIAAVAHYVNQTPDTLLVLDNVIDPAALQIPLTATIVAEQLPCRLLFTTRRLDIERYRPVELTTLPPDAALRLLLRHPRRREVLQPDHPDHPAAVRICAMLGYLPQALKVAGAQLGQWATAPVAQYEAELINRGALPVLDDRRGRRGVKAREAAVKATLQSMVATLDNEPEAQHLLRVAGQLPEAAQIPVARLGLLAGLPEQGEGFFAVTIGAAVQRLVDASLMEALAEDQIRLHPLVREFARDLTPLAEKSAFCQECAQNLANAYEDFALLEDHYHRRGIDALQEDLLVGLEMLSAADSPETHLTTWATHPHQRLEILLGLIQREAHTLRGRAANKTANRFAIQIGYRWFDQGKAGMGNVVDWLKTRTSWQSRWLAKRESAGLVRTLEGHGALVWAVAVTPDGQRAVSASDDRTLKVWNLQTGQAERTLEGHGAPVRAVAVTPDGQRAVSASSDRTLKVWNLQTGQAERTLEGHGDWVWAVAVFSEGPGPVTPDGQRAVSASDDRTLKVWNLQTGHLITTIALEHSLYCVAVAPDGRTVVAGDAGGNLYCFELHL